MTLFTRTKTAHDEVVAAIEAAQQSLDAVDEGNPDINSTKAASAKVQEIVVKMGQIQTDMQKLKKKASLPPDQRLLNEQKCKEILEFSGQVDESAEKVEALKSQSDIMMQVVVGLEAQMEEEKQEAERQRLAQEKQAEEEKQAKLQAEALQREQARQAQEKAAEEARRKEQEAAAAAAQRKAKEEEEERARKQAEQIMKEEAAKAAAATTTAQSTDGASMDTTADNAAVGISLKIKFVAGGADPIDVTVPSPESTVLELKHAIAEAHPDCEVGKQLLIAKGKRLEDNMTLSSARLANGHVVHLGLQGGTPVRAQASSPAGNVPRRPTRTKEQVVDETYKALSAMKSEVPYTIFLLAVNTLRRLMQNVLDHPGVPKYSRVRFNNDALQTKLFSKPHGVEAIIALGFSEITENDEKFFVMSDPPPPTLSQLKTMLDEAVAALTAASSARATP
eukprot:m.15823 g.15823  ORF g.15823 m.15823 type:complete len:450 (+) comp5499_c0_seq1:176-1525(+)